MYIDFGPVPNKPGRFGFALKVGKGKVIATSPPYSSRATCRTKAMKLFNSIPKCETVWEVTELRA